MTRIFSLKFFAVALLLQTIAALGQSEPAHSQPQLPAIEPLQLPGRDNQLYFGFLQTRYDYSLRTSSTVPAFRLTNNGGSLEYEFHQWSHFSLLSAFRYSSGGPLQQSLTTAGAAVRYSLGFKRFAPFGQLLGGYSRLTSNHAAGDMFLSNGAINSFTTLLGVGLDVNLNQHWGIRPFYIENQYLPSVGPQHSLYWSFGAGVVYRFHRRPR
jgi:hypothetical protein